MPPRRPGRGRQVQCHLHFLFSLKSTDANFLLWARAAVRTDGRSEARTLTGRGRWGDGEARTPRHPAPPPGLRPLGGLSPQVQRGQAPPRAQSGVCQRRLDSRGLATVSVMMG